MMIKVNVNGVLDGAVAINRKAKVINDGYKEAPIADLSGMSTMTKYKEYDKKIKELIKNYALLVEKDTGDIRKMLDKFSEADSGWVKTISKSMGSTDMVTNVASDFRDRLRLTVVNWLSSIEKVDGGL